MERVTVQYKGEQITLEVPDGTSDEEIFAHIQSQEQPQQGAQEPQQGAQEPQRPKVNPQREDRKSALEMGGAALAGTALVGEGASRVRSMVLPKAPDVAVKPSGAKAVAPLVAGSAVLGATTDALNPVPADPSKAYSAGRNITQGAFSNINQARQQSGQSMNTTMGGTMLNAGASLGNMVGGVVEGIGRYGNMPSWQNTGQSIADFTQGMMDAVNKEHPVAGRVGQYGAYIIPGSAGLKAVNKVAGPAKSVMGNVGRTAAVEGTIGAATTAGDTETRGIAGAYGAGGGAIGARLAGKGALQPGAAPSVPPQQVPPNLQANPAKTAVAQTIQTSPNAVSSGFAQQLKNAGESFSATKATAQSAGMNVDDATLIANRAKEIQENAAANGIKMPASSAKKQAQEELGGYNTQIANEQKAVKAKADADARAAREAQAAQRAQEEAAKKAAFEASPEGIAAKQAQEAEVAAKAQKEAESRARAQQITEQIRQNRAAEEAAKAGAAPSVPKPSPAMNPVQSKPGTDIIAEIRARGAMGEAPSVPANTPVAKTPSPALTKTREALAKQPADDMPTGMSALSEISNPKKPLDLTAIRAKLQEAEAKRTPAEIAENEKYFKARENRSSAQAERHAVTRDARDWVIPTKSKGVVTINKDTLNEWATSQKIVLDWKTAPDIKTMKPNEAKRAMSKWAQQQYKNFDPANPPKKEVNPIDALFGE